MYNRGTATRAFTLEFYVKLGFTACVITKCVSKIETFDYANILNIYIVKYKYFFLLCSVCMMPDAYVTVTFTIFGNDACNT